MHALHVARDAGELPMSVLEIASRSKISNAHHHGRATSDGPRTQQGERRLLAIAAVACVALTAGSARAADRHMPTKALPPAQACTTNWYQGWYLGLNFGGGGYTAY